MVAPEASARMADLEDRMVRRLVRAFQAIENEKRRASIVTTVEAIAAAEAREPRRAPPKRKPPKRERTRRPVTGRR